MEPSWGNIISTKCSTTGETTEELTILSQKTSTVLGTTGEIVPVGNSTGGAPAEANTTLRIGKTAPLNPKDDGTIMISLKGGSSGNQPSGACFIGAIWITPVE